MIGALIASTAHVMSGFPLIGPISQNMAPRPVVMRVFELHGLGEYDALRTI